jgi:hypothetical protein
MPRKYWFILFLATVFVACILALLEPSWERGIRTQVYIAVVVVIFWCATSQLSRIEGKLDAILKKLNGN